MEDGSFRLSCKLRDEKNKQILFEMDGMLASSELSFNEAYDWLLLRIEQTIPEIVMYLFLLLTYKHGSGLR